ncbi:hypothetical protein MACJ_002576 [Theileria orientalis]|uniref:Uncharacterized protein n=1 Tax=Theileria orientalis TaxID=68886 RepID=A0A976QRG4_THEOR|nr:hypothetical protein MACJ_002576 [Theileria orientalis]
MDFLTFKFEDNKCQHCHDLSYCACKTVTIPDYRVTSAPGTPPLLLAEEKVTEEPEQEKAEEESEVEDAEEKGEDSDSGKVEDAEEMIKQHESGQEDGGEEAEEKPTDESAEIESDELERQQDTERIEEIDNEREIEKNKREDEPHGQREEFTSKSEILFDQMSTHAYERGLEVLAGDFDKYLTGQIRTPQDNFIHEWKLKAVSELLSASDTPLDPEFEFATMKKF